MKRGTLVLFFLFVAACLLPLALAPPAQASGTMALNGFATRSDVSITARPAAPPGLYDPAASLFAEANKSYMDANENNQKIRGVWDNSLARPWTRSLEVSEILIYDDQFPGTKGKNKAF